MIDYYLKFADEAEMASALAAFYKQDTHIETAEDGTETTVVDGDPYLVMQTADYALDIVGTIYKPTGKTLTDADGMEYPEQAAIDGWHVNLRLTRDIAAAEDGEGPTLRDAVEALNAAYGTAPVTPARVWL